MTLEEENNIPAVYID